MTKLKLRFSETERQTEELTRTKNQPTAEILFEAKEPCSSIGNNTLEREMTLVNTCQIVFDLNQAEHSQKIYSSEWAPETCSFNNYDLIILKKQEFYVVFYL